MKIQRHKIYITLSVFVCLALVLGLFLYSRSERGTADDSKTTTPISYDAFDQKYITELAAIRPGCADRYKSVLAHTNTSVPDKSNFSVLRPLTDYTCGEFSDITTMPLADGKTIYFVAVHTNTDCGAGGCWYSAFLEEKPGLVLQLQGFNGYSTDYQINRMEPTLSPDPQGQVFGVLSVNKANGVVKVKQIMWCGPYMENIYQIVTDRPTLIASYEYKNDGCIGAPPTTIFRDTSISKNLTTP